MTQQVLLLRPQQRLADDLAACAALGWQGVPFSPMAIEAQPDALAQLPAQIAAADAVFWVSPTAVETAAWDFSDTLPHIAVGAATARVLRAAGAAQVYCPDVGQDSEAVMRLPVWDSLPAAATVLIVRGCGGREALAQFLRGRGLNVAFAEIYRRIPQAVDWALFQTLPSPCVWVTSAQAAHMLFAQTPPPLMQKLKSLLYLTHHPRIAAALQAQGITRIQQAADLTQALCAAHKCADNV
ncbi:uroporphyrinogen-III synthase [Conchiformibius steedae DSM 2580]|uniref:Uroporphyrinogen-III synthase n=1 Tax=Conchiformibius steedae DSM 2580 TaxID=1121352 RepID=A0AAE9HX86_9NEIS|nr:uroporphyrinogen-III synthase [Conchiformibius steedae]QMT32901.1 uroporphyrinogen-III synthase [Conchiformibius steedae]URD67520.1 uroporphyrinogen-III synthase [Conchiformibius steedae DSM 2580]